MYLRLTGDGDTSYALLQASQATTDTVDVVVHRDMLPVLRAIAIQMIPYSTHSQTLYHQWRDALYSITNAMMTMVLHDVGQRGTGVRPSCLLPNTTA